MRQRMLRVILGVTALAPFLLIGGCGNTDYGPLTDLETSQSYTMDLTMYDVPGMEGDIEVVYKHTRTDKYMRIASEEVYDIHEDDTVYRYETNLEGRLERREIDPERSPIIEPDTVILNPEDLDVSLLKEGQEEGVYILEDDDGYETLFGDKAEAVDNLALRREDDGTLRIVYTFDQEETVVMVEAHIADWEKTDIQPPFD